MIIYTVKSQCSQAERKFVMLLVLLLLLIQIFCLMPVEQHGVNTSGAHTSTSADTWPVNFHDPIMNFESLSDCETESSLLSVASLLELGAVFLLPLAVVITAVRLPPLIRVWQDRGDVIQTLLPPIYLQKVSFLE